MVTRRGKAVAVITNGKQVGFVFKKSHQAQDFANKVRAGGDVTLEARLLGAQVIR